MASSVLSIGISGIQAAQAGLATTSHNIANASVLGYNRQSIVQGTNVPQYTGVGFFGNGTNVETIKRNYSNFLSQQVLTADARYQELNTNYEQTVQVDDLLGDATTGLSSAVQDFFSGVQGVSADATSIPARQSMLSQAGALINRFQTLTARVNELRDQVGVEIGGSVTEINSIAKQISEINLRVVQLTGQGQPPNDILDQRDQLLSQLNQQVGITTSGNSDGSINVFIGNGQPLVVGNQYSTLQTMPAGDDLSRTAIGIKLPSGSALELPEAAFTGGKLTGLLAFRRDSLDKVQNTLGRIAISMTETFNAQHKLGQDLNGNLGTNFFVPLDGNVIYPNRPANTGTAQFNVPITNSSALTTSDYRLSYTAANTYQLVRQSDGQVWTATGTDPNDALTNLVAAVPDQGFSLNFTGTPNVGDSFLIEPTRLASSEISVAVTDPRLIAAGSPIRTQVPATNAGNATINQGVVSDITNLTPPAALTLPVTLTYSGGNLSGFPASFPITVTHADGTSTNYAAASSVPYKSGDAIGFGGISITISGQPADNDQFSVESNPPGSVSDSRNAVALAALQTGKTMIGGGASYEGAYAQLVSEIGSRTRELQVTSQSQQVVLQQVTDAKESNSGVNLDEEASNLIRYQQAYQASARVMDIASKLFDEVLAVARG
ncbi:flagellar hook-associated protein FlgK [Niveibacterium sp. SC-1]|uniref:flagellar hook-associated protein FlgK n=1 Tax=Niveibacterium sp. SC-1 TaxID=3135646 RepID=UPI00311D9B46